MLLAKLDLLILDDFGIGALSQINRGDLLEIADIRSGKPTIITSQIPVDKWHDYLSSGNPTIADAILDRFCSSAMRVNLKGESMRSRRLKEIQ
jgi:DNA replication protein DnaC